MQWIKHCKAALASFMWFSSHLHIFQTNLGDLEMINLLSDYKNTWKLLLKALFACKDFPPTDHYQMCWMKKWGYDIMHPRASFWNSFFYIRAKAMCVTAALRVTLRDMTETYIAVAWDRVVLDDHTSWTFQNVFAELVLWVEHFYS